VSAIHNKHIIMFDFFANHTVLEGDYALSDIKVEE